MLNSCRCTMSLWSVTNNWLCKSVRIMWLLGFMTLLSGQIMSVDSECGFPHHKIPPTLSTIKPLLGTRLPVLVDSEGKYEYKIGICESAVDPNASPDYSDVGVLQTDMNSKKHFRIGKFTATEFKNGTDWAMLEYRSGDQYRHHCGNGTRTAIIMITCDPLVHSIQDVNPIIVAEEKEKTSDCYYMFEISHSCVCNFSKKNSGLSIGSIVVIVFVALCAVYLLGGLMYSRFVLGAKGMEQIPNYNFWLDFGNLQADGCNLVCRTGPRSTSRTYKGIADDQLGDAEDDRDDHLLPM